MVRYFHLLEAHIHKMYYFSDPLHKNVELALCLYHFDFMLSSDYKGMIINTTNGKVIQQTTVENSNFLSSREKEILSMIQSGKRSKEIASSLFISINTFIILELSSEGNFQPRENRRSIFKARRVGKKENNK